jgi:hypothetical protein
LHGPPVVVDVVSSVVDASVVVLVVVIDVVDVVMLVVVPVSVVVVISDVEPVDSDSVVAGAGVQASGARRRALSRRIGWLLGKVREGGYWTWKQ